MTTIKIISLGFLAVGLFLIMQVVLPIISFQLWEISQKYNNQILKSPILPKVSVLGISIQTKDNFPVLISSRKRESKPIFSEFKLTIPKINLAREAVFVDSNDLAKGLAHLPGSALPGERGNVFISGHSALSSLWSNVAYFAKLPDVKKGDKIEVEASGSKFAYQVVEIKIVNPTDLSIILPPDEKGRYISLMTCVPPGLNFKRLIVLGKML